MNSGADMAIRTGVGTKARSACRTEKRCTMQAKDIMTTNVISVAPETSVDAIATLLLERNISAVPVVDSNNRILGIVSEGDLVHRVAVEGGRRGSWWLSLMASREEQATEFTKTHGRRADEIMTRDVVVVGEDTAVAEIARLLEQRRIKRVPVVRDHELVGIVSRANLLHGLAASPQEIAAPSSDDRSIREALVAALESEGWLTHGNFNVTVTNGAVEIWGWAETDQERQAIKVVVENTPGVVSVADHLGALPPWAWGA